MKKALVIGGANGIGLALVNSLLEKEYFVSVLDIVAPDVRDLLNNNWEYKYINLFNLDLDILNSYRDDTYLDTLLITAGIGRVTKFGNMTSEEITKNMTINATSTMQVIHYFWSRINADNQFFCGVLVSIAGMISSPLFSIYSASKAALYRFIESVNIELEMSKSENRILNISPGAIKGTQFNGGKNDLSQTTILAQNILKNLFDKEVLFIPDFEHTYSAILERYHQDPHKFGIDSYEYKMSSNRLTTKPQIKIGYLSGTFDLFHVGHLNLLKRAKEHCDYLIVGIHPDASHKGKETFISYEERKEIVKACRYVDQVVQSFPEDCDAWDKYQYDKLFVGSDYKGTERFNRYEEYFKDKGVEIIYFPYTSTTSSTQIRRAILEKIEK